MTRKSMICGLGLFMEAQSIWPERWRKYSMILLSRSLVPEHFVSFLRENILMRLKNLIWVKK